MTTDRDVRLSHDQLRLIEIAVRDELRKRRKSVERASASRAAGNRVQYGVLDEHLRAISTASQVLEIVDVALRQIDHLRRGA